MSDARPLLSIDFDSMFHNAYSSGNRPLTGSIDFLRQASSIFDLSMVSSRSVDLGSRQSMRSMLWEAIRNDAAATTDDEQWFNRIEWPLSKPAGSLLIDALALTFNGPPWPTIEQLVEFKPWHQRPERKALDDPAEPFRQQAAEDLHAIDQ